MELHVPTLEALGYTEKLSFVGDGQDDSMGADACGTCFARSMDSHRKRDARGKVVTDDDVVKLLDLGLFTTSRVAKRVKRSSKSWVQPRHRACERQVERQI